jgi:hypothetical protein
MVLFGMMAMIILNIYLEFVVLGEVWPAIWSHF